MQEDAALLIVDMQNDFCPGGALPVPDGNRVVEPINRAIKLFSAAGLPVLASRDWHPPDTKHFRDFGGPWPAHCIQGSRGADFHHDLQLTEEAVLISKGLNLELAGYSAFEGLTTDGRTLEELLQESGIKKLYICGLATDYCVLCTTREALRKGYKVTVLTDSVAGVDIVPGESICALEEMEKAGARLATVEELQESK